MLQEDGRKSSNPNQDQRPLSSDSRSMYPWDEQQSSTQGFTDTLVYEDPFLGGQETITVLWYHRQRGSSDRRRNRTPPFLFLVPCTWSSFPACWILSKHELLIVRSAHPLKNFLSSVYLVLFSHLKIYSENPDHII